MNAERRRTSLRPEPFRPGLALPVSVIGHLGVFAIIWAFSARAPSAHTLIDPDDVIEVSMVSLPAPKTAVPQKAIQRPPPPPPPRPAEPVPQAVAAPEAEPIPAPPPEEDTLQRDAQREEVMRQMKREALLDSLRSAPEGTVTQSATTEAGEEDGSGSDEVAIGDAERARYSEEVRRVFYRDFSPLQDESGLSAVAWVWVNAEGRVLRHELRTPSGNGSFDAAVVRAIRLVSSVPAPPAGLVSGGDLRLDLVFRTEDR